jgi:hypothetical protein
MGTPLHAQRKRSTDSVDVTIRLSNRGKTAFTDSVLVIFDRYDHSGAGIIRKVYYPINNEIVISKVPPARYYIEVSCLGTHREQFNELTYVNNRRSNVFTYRINKTGTFTPGLAVIPIEPVNLNKLEILKQ